MRNLNACANGCWDSCFCKSTAPNRMFMAFTEIFMGLFGAQYQGFPKLIMVCLPAPFIFLFSNSPQIYCYCGQIRDTFSKTAHCLPKMAERPPPPRSIVCSQHILFIWFHSFRKKWHLVQVSQQHKNSLPMFPLSCEML